LIETWSVFEQNKAERAKTIQPKAAAKNEKQGKEPASVTATPIEVKLQRFIASLPVHNTLTSEVIELTTNTKEDFMNDVDRLIENLEKHLTEWKRVKESLH
jgi:ParB family transcriptional regulator, chromosome partitioning protein